MPHKADIQIGPLTSACWSPAVMSQTGEYLGNAFGGADVTEKRKMEQQALAMSKSQAVIGIQPGRHRRHRQRQLSGLSGLQPG